MVDEALEARVRVVCDIAEMEQWDEEKTEKELRRVHREYHLEILEILGRTYKLKSDNLEQCRREIREKYPD